MVCEYLIIPSLYDISKKDFFKDSKSAVIICLRAIMTSDPLNSNCGRKKRINSLILLFALFLITAQPNFLPAQIPNSAKMSSFFK